MANSWKTRFRRARGGRLSRWLGRIDGVEKPALLVGLGMVLFRVWKAGDPSLSRADRWRQADRPEFFIVLKVTDGYRDCASQPDGWHQYGPAAPYDAQLPYSVTISPGCLVRYWMPSSW